LTFPNDISAVKIGKDGNAIYSENKTGQMSELKVRVIRASADDKFLTGLLASQNASFASFVLMQGSFIKKLGDGLGNLTSDTYILGGGIFKRNVDGKANVEGDTEQSVSIYTLHFASSQRVLT